MSRHADWSMASSLRSQAAAAARAGVHATGARAAAAQTQMYHHALATGFSRGYLVSAAIMALAAIIALALIRIGRQDLSGADPMSEPGRLTPPYQCRRSCLTTMVPGSRAAGGELQ